MQKSTKGALMGLTAVVAGVGFVGERSGYVDYRNPRGAEEWQLPFTLHPEAFEEVPFDTSGLPLATTAQTSSMSARLKSDPEAHLCPDGSDNSEVVLVGQGVSKRALCIDLASVALMQAGSTTWIRAEAIYPPEEGHASVDLPATYEGVSRDVCIETTSALRNLLQHRIEELDSQANTTIRYLTQIVLDDTKPSHCDEIGYIPPSDYPF